MATTLQSSTTSVEKDPVVSFVVGEFERYERNLQDRFELASQIYKQWKNEPPKRDLNWQNAVHVPLTFEGEQTISPRLTAALFPNDAPLEIRAEGETPEELAIRVKSLLQHHFRLSNVDIEAALCVSQATLLGTGYLYAPWLHKTKWQVNRAGERYKAVVDNRPTCESCDFFEIYPHPAKITMDDGLPLIRRRYCDAEYLKKLAAMPQFKFQNLEEALRSEPVTHTYSTLLDENGNKLELKKREQYEILSYWGDWDASYKKEDGEAVVKPAEPYWIMVINRAVKIRSIANPYNHQMPPFIKVTLYSDIKKNWFGIGMGQVGKPTQERVNKIVNQRLDNVDLVLNKQGVYNGNDTLINVKKLQVSTPGRFHKCSDVNQSIKFIDTPDVTASSYKEEEIAKQDYRESTGATVPLMPTDDKQHRTASGINLLQGAAGARFRPVLRKMEVELIQGLGMIYLSNLQQFMALPEWVDLINKDGSTQPIKISPEDIQGKVYFIPTGVSEIVNKETQIGQLLRFKEVTMNDPTVNRKAINVRIAKLFGFKDLDELFVEQPPIQAGPGQLSPAIQEKINQRIAEGATPEQIKLELLGQPPAVGT